MTPALPLEFDNPAGERIVVQAIETTPQGDKVVLEGFCEPGCGPIMHTHLQQDEGLQVVSGRMGYQVPGEKPVYLEAGQSVVFKAGTPHRFWADGSSPLHVRGFVQPAHNVIFYLHALYAAQRKSGKAQPDPFDAAYLMTRYAAEYDLPEMPAFVKKVMLPLTYQIGKLLGKYGHFADAPEPLRPKKG